MTRRGFSLFMAAIAVVVFLSANMLSNVWLRGVRIDATADRVYSLSPGTRRVLSDLAEPVDLTFFYSATAAQRYPALRAYALRVREFLQSYAGRGSGKIRLHEIEPARFSESEDAASAAGIAPITPAQGAEPVYLGISGANAADARATIPRLDPAREAFLEYDITRLITELDNPRKLNVAIISSLPLDAAALTGEAQGLPLFFTELARGAEIEVLPRDFVGIPEQASLLLVLQPWPLSQQQLFAIDQFVMREGRAVFAVDPAAIGWDELGAAQVIAPQADLNTLFAAWGVTAAKDVVIDGANALNVETPDAFGRTVVAPQPLYFKTPAAQLARGDLITVGLRGAINFAAPGALSWRAVDGITVTPLVTSSTTSARMRAEAALARPSPQTVISAYRPSGKAETLALRLSGIAPSAFGGTSGGLSKSSVPVQVVVVSDIDFLNDGFYVGANNVPFADNAAFLLNAIDMTSGSDALVSLRSRSASARPMTAIQAMQASAAAKSAVTQDKLRKELAEVEGQLAARQARSGQTGPFRGALGEELSAGERDAIEGFRAKALELRAELRRTERDLRRDVDALEGRYTFLNVWLIPLLLAGAALFVAWRRTQRAGAAR